MVLWHFEHPLIYGLGMLTLNGNKSNMLIERGKEDIRTQWQHLKQK